MDQRYQESLIDWIHYLVEQSNLLKGSGNHGDAEVLTREAEYFAKCLRDEVHPEVPIA